MPPDHNLDDYVDPHEHSHRHSPGGRRSPLRVGLGGPVGSGKTALAAALCRTLGAEYDLAVVTNDIYTTEDADFLRRNAVLPDDRIEAVQTGCCPHTAIRDDITANLDAVELLESRHPGLELVFLESGGDNLTASFSYGLVDVQVHAGDAVAAQAQSDLTVAYNRAAGRACDVTLTGQDLGGLTLTSGVYCFASSAQLTGDLTLNAQGDPEAVFIFQIGSTLTTASDSNVNLINAAQSCNVFWQIGSSATLGTTTTFRGNILALTSITANTGATVEDGRLLARNGAVTLDTNTVTRAECATPPPPPPPPDEDGPDVVIIGGGPGDGVPGNPTHPPGGGSQGPPGGGEKPCVERDFRLRIRTRDESGIRRVEVFLDGRLIKRTTRRRFRVWIRAESLRAGRHKIRVVARDRAGNRTVKRRIFKRCERPEFPDFTGRVGHRS